MATSIILYRYLAKMNMASNMATEWKRLRDQWRNCETAADLESESTAKRAAIFLARVGSEAYELFQTLEFADDDDRKDIDKVIEAFEHHCIGKINVRVIRVQSTIAGYR